jgi:hypothetical protein
MIEQSKLAEPLPKARFEEPSESANGVDLTLIQWMLSLSPLERLAVLQDWADGLTELRRGRIVES